MHACTRGGQRLASSVFPVTVLILFQCSAFTLLILNLKRTSPVFGLVRTFSPVCLLPHRSFTTTFIFEASSLTAVLLCNSCVWP